MNGFLVDYQEGPLKSIDMKSLRYTRSIDLYNIDELSVVVLKYPL